MIPQTRTLIASLDPLAEQMSGTQTLDLLAKRGLIDRRAAEALFARSEVERLARKGRPRCLAMVQVSEILCCSYQKVRNLIYDKEI